MSFYKDGTLTLQSESDWHPQVWSPIQIGVGYWQFRSLSWHPGNYILYSTQAWSRNINSTWTAAIRGTAVSRPTVEAVVVVLITDLVEAHTLRVLQTDCWLTEVVSTLVTVRTVLIVHTASLALAGLTVGTEVRCVGRGKVAGPVRVLTLRVLGAATGRTVGAGAVHVTVTSVTLVTVRVSLALRILGTGEGAVDNIRPVTDRAQGVLVRHVEGESPLAQTPGVLIRAVLTTRTLEQAGLALGSTLPESAAVWTGKRVTMLVLDSPTCRVFVIVRLLGDGINKFAAVWHNTAVIGETVHPGVVGDCVIFCGCRIRSDQTHQHHQHPGCHGRSWVLLYIFTLLWPETRTERGVIESQKEY